MKRFIFIPFSFTAFLLAFTSVYGDHFEVVYNGGTDHSLQIGASFDRERRGTAKPGEQDKNSNDRYLKPLLHATIIREGTVSAQHKPYRRQAVTSPKAQHRAHGGRA